MRLISVFRILYAGNSQGGDLRLLAFDFKEYGTPSGLFHFCLGKKGLKKFLKPVRKFLGETIGAIPFIGDLIGFLLDIFVFGEPPGRAAFMAIGSALLGFLGGLLGSFAGPIGTVALGILGGMAGDMLGGFLFD